MKHALYLSLAFLTHCGADNPPMFPLVVYLPNDVYPDQAQAIGNYSDDLNETLECQAITFTNKRVNVAIRWTNNEEFARTFPVVRSNGGASLPSRRIIWGPNGDYFDALEFWFAVDYENIQPDEIGRIWLGWIGWMTGLEQSDDKYSIMYRHPTWNEKPVKALIEALGGIVLARDKLCNVSEVRMYPSLATY